MHKYTLFLIKEQGIVYMYIFATVKLFAAFGLRPARLTAASELQIE